MLPMDKRLKQLSLKEWMALVEILLQKWSRINMYQQKIAE